jgi:chorismate-pyruvate lyase
MTESLSLPRIPEPEHALRDLLCWLTGDIRLILAHPDLGNAAKLARITKTIDQLAPAHRLDADGTQTASLVAELLARNTGPATVLFEELAGEQVRIDLTGRADRELTEAECRELRVDPGARGHLRTGTLRTADSGLVAAEVHSLVVPGRLPAAARLALGLPAADEPAPAPSDIPLGKVLARLGVRREPLGARLVRDRAGVFGSRVSVESSARMWLADMPVALAGERVTAEYCQRVVSRLAWARDSPDGGDRPADQGRLARERS